MKGKKRKRKEETKRKRKKRNKTEQEFLLNGMNMGGGHWLPRFGRKWVELVLGGQG